MLGLKLIHVNKMTGHSLSWHVFRSETPFFHSLSLNLNSISAKILLDTDSRIFAPWSFSQAASDVRR